LRLHRVGQRKSRKGYGSIEAGKRADMIILDRNLFAIEPHDIDKAQVLMTLFYAEMCTEL
jgi:predicted amidohydrolase YtcJ